ncbi:hypothetical protein BC567DRAFT_217253 [Phyllosticta citribraziliensis]
MRAPMMIGAGDEPPVGVPGRTWDWTWTCRPNRPVCFVSRQNNDINPFRPSRP